MNRDARPSDLQEALIDPSSRSSFSGYRAPSTLIFEAAASMSQEIFGRQLDYGCSDVLFKPA